jgi:predicted Zn-ribbon and HTH transcriptional regulator
MEPLACRDCGKPTQQRNLRGEPQCAFCFANQAQDTESLDED